jgi:bromodomain-containing factor 1
VGGGAPRSGQHALQRECDHLLSSLRRDRTNVQYFLAPVDPVALNAPNYLEVVKRPMDLGTVARKLRDVSGCCCCC